MKHVLNRKQPAPLPSSRMLTRRVAVELPTTVDLRPCDGPIKDQQALGCCTGETKASTAEWITRRYLPKLGPLVFSPLFGYVVELLAQGSFPQDEGSDGVTLCDTAISKGFAEESTFPFGAGKITAPTPEALANGLTHRFVGAYHGLTGSATAFSVMGDPTPWPVMMGFEVFSGLESDECAATGVMPAPEPRETPLGGHEVKASGYDVGLTPALRPASCGPAVLFQNSWGADWGLKGYFWVPVSVLDAVTTDLKIMHLGKPW